MNNPTFPQWISVPGKTHAAACSLDFVVRSTLEQAKDPVTGTLKTETISPLEALRDSLYVQLRRINLALDGEFLPFHTGN